MSWIFVESEVTTGDQKSSLFPHALPLWSISFPGLYIAAGGNADTCFWASNPKESSGWVVVGVGILRTDSGFSILTRDEWGTLLVRGDFDPHSLDGHFVALRWKVGQVECYTDQLGLRTVYFAENKSAVCMSTRLDWVARMLNRVELDFATMGSRWLMFNQVSHGSCIFGIERVGPGGCLVFKNGRVSKAASSPWLPSFRRTTVSNSLEVLDGLIQCARAYDDGPSLGLSGGLDSRLLLTFLMKGSDGRFATHTFGDPRDPDVRIAGEIAKFLNVQHRVFDDPLPDPQTSIHEISAFVAQTILIEPCSSFLKLRYYRKLREYHRLMIDGGFGEIARRQYLNRVVRLGRTALKTKDLSRLFRLMRTHRADIFSAEVTAQLEAGACRDLGLVLREMPAVQEIGVENFADLLAVRTRVANYGSPEQARIDGEILNFMPLVQPSFLQAVFGLPVQRRADAGIYYRIIRDSNVGLHEFPLAGGGTHSFGLSSNVSWLLSKLKARLPNRYSDPKPDLLFSHLKEYVLDVAHSREVSENPIYDYPKLIDLLTRYYRGEFHLRRTLDWWLTFELWIRSLREA